MAAIVAIACACGGAFLAWHYPLAPAFMLAAFAAACVASFLRPEIWLFALPAALPAIGLASWSGWIAFEEIDILVLAVAAGGYGALVAAAPLANAVAARDGPAGTASARPVRLSGIVRTAIVLFVLSILIGLYRGIAGAATAEFGWFSGYNDAINSLRIAKSFLFALLLYPLLRIQALRSGRRTLELLFAGLAAGLAVASTAVVWERLAFPGLLNFSTDYRATALFWEMHVGGAALDGFLVLTLPFAAWQLLHRTTPLRWALAGGLALLAGYACLATFSRGVYLAIPVSMGLLTLLVLMQRRSLSLSSAARAFAKGCVPGAAFAAAAYVVFRSGGYRAMLAVLAVAMLTLVLRSSVRRVSPGTWAAAIALGCLLSAAGGIAAPLVPKGNYVVFAAAFAICAGLLWEQRGRRPPGRPLVAMAAYVWVVVAAAIVATGWGGVSAMYDTSIVLLLLLALAIWSTRTIDGALVGRPSSAKPHCRCRGAGGHHDGRLRRRRLHGRALRHERTRPRRDASSIGATALRCSIRPPTGWWARGSDGFRKALTSTRGIAIFPASIGSKGVTKHRHSCCSVRGATSASASFCAFRSASPSCRAAATLSSWMRARLNPPSFTSKSVTSTFCTTMVARSESSWLPRPVRLCNAW